MAPERWLLGALLTTQACSSGRLAIELPAELLASDVQTIVLARVEGDRAEAIVVDRVTTTDAQLAELAPSLPQWSGEAARFVAIGYKTPPTDLDLRPGSTAVDTGDRVAYPANPALQLDYDLSSESGWRSLAAVPRLLEDEGLPGVIDPLRCAQISVAVTRVETLRQIRWSFHAVAATSARTAVALGQACSNDQPTGEPPECPPLGLSDEVIAFEIGPLDDTETASVTPRPLGLPHRMSSRVHSAAFFDGKVWAAGGDGTLVILDTRARLLAHSPPNTVTNLRLDDRGELYGFGPSGVMRFVAGSTVARVVSSVAVPAPPCQEARCSTTEPRLSMKSANEMLFVDVYGGFHRFAGGVWSRLPPPDPQLGQDVLYYGDDELALTESALYRLTNEGWEAVAGDGFAALRGLYRDPEGRLITHGTLGRMYLFPSPEVFPRSCAIVFGNSRDALRVSVDRSGATAFVVDTYEKSPSEGPALVRVTLPPVE